MKSKKSKKNPEKIKEKKKKKQKKKNAIPLVLPFKEISLRPELSSPLRLKIQWGWSEREKVWTNKGQKEILVSNTGCNNFLLMHKKLEDLTCSQNIIVKIFIFISILQCEGRVFVEKSVFLLN